MKVNGNRITLTAMECLSIRMAKSMKDSGRWTNNMVKASKLGRTVVSTKGSFGMGSRKGTGDISWLTETCTKGNGKIICFTAKALSKQVTAEYTREAGLKDQCMVKVSIPGPLVSLTKGSIKMT